MIRDIWIEVSDFLFKSRRSSFLDMAAMWVWCSFIWPALVSTLPLWSATLNGLALCALYNGISGYGLYKFTKTHRSEYFYEKG